MVRSRCSRCGTLLSVELEELVARHGPSYTLVDWLELCRLVGYIGSTFYVAPRICGCHGTTLLRDPAFVATFEAAVPTHTALGWSVLRKRADR